MVSTHLRIIKRSSASESRYKGLLKNDNQLAMFSRWPTCLGGPNDASVGEISLKTGKKSPAGRYESAIFSCEFFIGIA
jgi:hypothetical protein